MPETMRIQLTGPCLRGVALHEAGHAIVAAVLGVPVERVLIRPDGTGLTSMAEVDMTAGQALTILAAGPMAERLLWGESGGDGWCRGEPGGDWHAAQQFAADEGDILVAEARAAVLVRQHAAAIRDLADVIEERGSAHQHDVDWAMTLRS